MRATVLAVGFFLMVTAAHVSAEKPEWAGKGKPDISEVADIAEAEELEEQIEDREKELNEKIKQKTRQSKERKK